MNPNKILIMVLFVCALSCKNNNQQITNQLDYNTYLQTDKDEVLQLALADYAFWEKKLEKDPNQFPYLVKAAAAQSLLFNKTGNIESLIKAEKHLIDANKATNYKKSGYLRALARNYISQHKFKSSLELLKKAEAIGENLESTQKMLFDVYLELGNYKMAKQNLNTFEDFNDFDYLIRLSKWLDHKGNLDGAIKYLDKAMAIAESSNLPGTKQWTYTNLADYYGHAGLIEMSYNFYLKALEIDPNDAYAKKGIAWIVYSYEKNPDEALRILNAVTQGYNAPDYHLLKSEIAEFKNDENLKLTELELYQKDVSNPLYGDMYNKYNALLLAENQKKSAKALAIANQEIANRPTPQSYDLLAWTYYNHGDVKDALAVMEKYVVGKTFEPETLFHLAKVYKANGKFNDAKNLKKELLESTFELGPLMAEKIKNI
ncbi:hypothetical protein GCM10022291_32310 [Postechiella marina]|uniref:Cell surface protein n=1 Tax=Postechiella marina TaxID=943941 RepID=A0ABP8CGX6_9FLAO